MAVTSIHAIKATEWAAIRYITDADKTVNGLYVSSYGCRADSTGALELQSQLIKLRDEYNALVPEHNAFLLKKETASKYTMKVRSYLADEHNKREREQSIKSSQNHRRNGFSLE